MIRGPLLAAILVMAAVPSLARSPRTGDLALTLAGGVSLPHDRALDGEPGFALSMEMYWTAANSMRGTLGFLDMSADDDSDPGDIFALYLTFNVAHNWHRGAVFPYVTGGAGIYAREERNGAAADRNSVETGLNGGLGVEFRLRDALTLRLEGLVHAMTGDGPSTMGQASLGITFYF